MTGLIIGNFISLIAAVFTAMSSWSRDGQRIYTFQVCQCLLLALGSVFFASYAGIVTLLVCAWRNYLASKDQLTKKWIFFCVWMILVFGLAVNNRGMIGILVVATNVIYSLGVYYARSEKAIKYNIILNLTLWIVYEVFIIDIPSAVADAAGLVSAVLSLFRPTKMQKETQL